MWTLTGFADEIGNDFGEQLSVLSELGIRHLELRSAWGVNVLNLSVEQRATAKQLLDDAGISVSSIGSPIGKINIAGDFAAHLRRMGHAAHVAHQFGAPYIRLFSFFIDAGDDPDRHRDEVIARMTALASVAEKNELIALHENEKEIFGDIPRRCVDITESVGSPNLRLIMDPANFVQCGVDPFGEAYPMMREHLAYLHIKDARFDTGEVVPAGEGDGRVRELIRALCVDGFDGFFSIEPHLGSFDAFGGFCGPQSWKRAHRAFVALLEDEGIAFQ